MFIVERSVKGNVWTKVESIGRHSRAKHALESLREQTLGTSMPHPLFKYRVIREGGTRAVHRVVRTWLE